MAVTALAHYPAPFEQKPERRAESIVKSAKLWLCAYFPDLALESLNLDTAQAVATLETVKGRPSLQSLSAAARRAGVEPGMSQSAALTLCPALTISLRDPEAERLALLRLADAALNFSPWLSLDKPQCLLLEIGACLSLFGGAKSLREKLRQALLGLNHRPIISISPSSEASLLLTRQGLERLILDSRALQASLGPLPITALPLPAKTVDRLQRTGIHRLSDLWRLPRDGLSRRYGAALLRQLDALIGHDDTPHSSYRPPQRFSAHRDMPAELERIDHFFPAIEQLAKEFSIFLLESDRTALGLTLEIRHYALAPSLLELEFRAGSRDPNHWLGLLREKLERSPLPAPVIAIALSSDKIIAFQPAHIGLFDTADEADENSE